jgi:acyl-CoA thioesterase FadM
MSWIETYRGTVYRWEVDNVDHFTVAYYFARFDDATAGLLDAVGLGREALAGAGRAAHVGECRVRYLKELRVGDILHIQSGVIEAGDRALVLGHRVFESGAGALCTTVEQRAVLLDGDRAPLPLDPAQRDAARAHRVEWEAERVVGLEPAPESGALDEARFVASARDSVKPWEVDPRGLAAPPAYIHRFSAANAHLLAGFGMTPAFMREERRGFSTFEFRLRFPGVLRAGDAVLVRSGLLHMGNSSMRVLHRMARARSGEVVATLEQSGVLLDVAARRPALIPDELRARAKAVLLRDRLTGAR